MPFRFIPVDLSAAIAAVDLSINRAAHGAAIRDARRLDAGEDLIELGFIHSEAEVLNGKWLVGFDEIER